MSFLKIADKIAVAAMFAVIGGIPLAVSAGQLLNEDSAQEIRAGMTSGDVVSRLGTPYAKERFERTKTTAWDYHQRDAWGYDAVFSVIFGDDGRVVSKISVRTAG